MSCNILEVGDTITIPFSDSDNCKGIVMYINSTLDPKMKYEVWFDEPPVILFFNEFVMRRIVKGKFNKDDLRNHLFF